MKQQFSRLIQSISSNKRVKILLQTKNVNVKTHKVIAGILAVLILSGSAYYLNSYVSAVYLIIDGEQIGLVPNEASGQKLIDQVLQEYGQPQGITAKTKQTIDYESVRVAKGTLSLQTLNKDILKEKISPYVEGYTLQVSGESVAVLPTSEDAARVLEELKNYYSQMGKLDKIDSVEILEDVVTQKVETTPDKLKSFEQVIAMLKEGKQRIKEYTVEADDSWWLIARKNNMLTKEVLAGNPNFTEDTILKPGQKLKLVSSTPYISVVTKGEYSASEVVPFDVETKIDNTLAGGQIQVTQQGNDGRKEVKYSVILKNGKVDDRKVMNETITQKPVTQKISKGPIVVAQSSYGSSGNVSSLSRGTGNAGFSWPLRGNVTSYYGWRSRGFHNGIDIEGETGEPIIAAASGKVIEAGWTGGYGLMVLIDHGNGIVTRYSHASKLLVSKGQAVNKGQTIAQVGSTGNSTGSHLEFQVIANGSAENPLRYLP